MASRVQLSGPQEAEKYVLHMVRLVTRLNSPNLKIDPTEDFKCLGWQGTFGTAEEQLFFRVESAVVFRLFSKNVKRLSLPKAWMVCLWEAARK